MSKIKLRENVKDIKVLDKSQIAAEHMKDAFVKTKDKAESGYYSNENSPSEYATDNVSHGVENMTREAGHQFNKQGQKGVETTKQNIDKAKQKFRDFKERKSADTVKNATDLPKEKAKEQAKKKTQDTFRRSARQTTDKTIKTSKQAEKTIKQSARSTAKTVKFTGKGTVKAAQKSVKTAEHTAKATIKTTQQTAKAAQAAVKTSAKAAQKAAQAAKITAKATVHAVKVAVKATVSAIKAIIAGTKALISAIIAGGWITVLIILIVVLFGALFSLVGGSGSNSSYTPVSAEVQAYEPLIQKYAKEHGIPEYVELIKAVMMQESGGHGNDPMQASECGYNTRYPNTPNGITDPEYSINVGVQNLAACLNAAGAESPIDMDNIKLALQGYNYGNGYISWAKSNYGSYTYANAVEFSTMQAERLGWSSYGDTQYVSHVLRYYPFGRMSTGIGNQAIVEVAASQIGNVGGQPYWSWYGFDSRVEWCACFVSWCAEQCGHIESGIIPKFSLCTDGVAWFQQHGQWQDGTFTPSAGHIIFFDWEGDDTTDHVGIVEKVENGTVYTIEGNSNDSCRQRSYAVGSSVIYGYGIPIY